MFSKNSLKPFDLEKAINYYNKRIIEVDTLDYNIFRTDYLKNKFSMYEYVSRLEEIYLSGISLNDKLIQYLSIENILNKNLEFIEEDEKITYYFALGYFIHRVLKMYNKNVHYNIYDYAVLENDDLITLYFDIELDGNSIDFTLLKDLLSKILNVNPDYLRFNKRDNIYELVLIKKNMLSVTFADIIETTDFSLLESEGYNFPLVIGKDDSFKNIYVDFSNSSSYCILGNSGSGKSNLLNVILLNLISLYGEDEVRILLMDSASNELNRFFGHSLHSIGYHKNILDFTTVLDEVILEIENRKEILKSANVENWVELREQLDTKETNDLLKAFPWLVIVLDDLKEALNSLNSLGSDDVKLFSNKLSYILNEGNNLGITFITTYGDEYVFNELNEAAEIINLIDSKILLKMRSSEASKFVDLMQLDVPNLLGEFILIENGNPFPVKGRCINLGTFDNEKIHFLIKVLCVNLLKSYSTDDNLFEFESFSFSNNRDFYIDLNEFTDDSLFEINKDNNVSDIAKALLKGTFNPDKFISKK